MLATATCGVSLAESLSSIEIRAASVHPRSRINLNSLLIWQFNDASRPAHSPEARAVT